MSKKDYEVIAAVFAARLAAPGLVDRLSLALLAADLGRVLKQDNPLFDIDRFIVACGL